MSRIKWGEAGSKVFEAGVDRGVLYVGPNPGVPWVGLTSVENSGAGGKIKDRYLDGVMISNRASPETYEGKLEAFTYPDEFEQCDGTARLSKGLRVMHQPRKSFGLCYRTKIGNDVEGLDHGYRLHFLYNLRAEPSDRSYQTMSDESDVTKFSWSLHARHSLVEHMKPTSYLSIDSRDVPYELLTQLESILYGDESKNARLPGPGELVFMFDAFQDNVYDAGSPLTPVFVTYDAGEPSTPFTNTIDGGAV